MISSLAYPQEMVRHSSKLVASARCYLVQLTVGNLWGCTKLRAFVE